MALNQWKITKQIDLGKIDNMEANSTEWTAESNTCEQKNRKVNNLHRIQTLHKMTTISKHISVNIGNKTSFLKVNKTKTVTFLPP